MMLCPNCSVAMMLLTSTVYKHKDGSPKKLLQCPTCDCRHTCHPNGDPVGIPASGETRSARMRLHALIDPLWNQRKMSRNAVYRMMRQLFGRDIHIGALSKQECDDMYDRMRQHMKELGYDVPESF